MTVPYWRVVPDDLPYSVSSLTEPKSGTTRRDVKEEMFLDISEEVPEVFLGWRETTGVGPGKIESTYISLVLNFTDETKVDS